MISVGSNSNSPLSYRHNLEQLNEVFRDLVSQSASRPHSISLVQSTFGTWTAECRALDVLRLTWMKLAVSWYRQFPIDNSSRGNWWWYHPIFLPAPIQPSTITILLRGVSVFETFCSLDIRNLSTGGWKYWEGWITLQNCFWCCTTLNIQWSVALVFCAMLIEVVFVMCHLASSV